MLVLDSHGSYVTPEFDQYCIQNHIVTVFMPPNSSYILQPLDVSCFAVLKCAYGAKIHGKMRSNIHYIDKFDFLALYLVVRQETFKSTTICQGFLATGLVPYDPPRIMAKLQVDVQKTPTPPGSSHSNSEAPWVPETPHNSIQLPKKQKKKNSGKPLTG